MNKYILHIDANSAYLSWTAAHMLSNGHPVDLREIPSVVGGSEKSRHGIVLAKSTPAKKFKIQTGEPLMTVRQKCPDITIVPPDYSLYMKASQAMYEIIYSYTPVVQRFSIDECFAEITIDGGREEIVELAYEIKDRIHKELGFTTNVGVGLNKIQAKMGGELKKPNMVHTLWPEEIEEKLWPLEVGELFMVGQKTGAKLRNLCIMTIGDLATANTKMLENHLKSYAYLIQAYANGRDDSPVRPSNRPVVKGIGNGCTARYNVLVAEEAYLHLMSLTESVGERLRASKYCAGLIAVSYTTTEFVTKSRQRKLSVAMDSTSYIMKIAKELFDELWQGESLRKFRVRVSDLYGNDYVQLSLLETFDFEREKSLDIAVDNIRKRYGGQAIYRACFLHSGVRSGAGGVGDEEDYPLMTSIL